jgi:hypothetical protein
MQKQLFFSEFSVRTMNPGGGPAPRAHQEKGMAFDPYVPRGAAYPLPLFAFATRISGVGQAGDISQFNFQHDLIASQRVPRPAFSLRPPRGPCISLGTLVAAKQ